MRRGLLLIVVLILSCVICCSCEAMLGGFNNSNTNNKQTENKNITMPNLVGLMLPEAKTSLSNLGIKDITVNTNNNEFVIDSNNWIVFNQGNGAGSIISNGDKVVLTVGRVSDFVSEYFNGKSLNEIYDFSADKNFSIDYIDEATGESVQFQRNDDDFENWTITKYESVSKNKNSARVWLKYSGSAIVPSVKGMIVSEAKEILERAHIFNVDVESESDESIWNYSSWIVIEQSIPENETIEASETITLKVEKYVAPTPTPTPEKILDEKFPKEMAYRAIVTAITNYYALDVLTKDEVDVKKFHSYSDKSGKKADYYLTVKSDGIWTANDDETWHVNGIKLYKAGFDSTFEVTADIRQTESGYEIYNVIDAHGTTPSNTTVYPNTDKAFSVKEELVKDDRQPDPTPTPTPMPSPTPTPTPTPTPEPTLTPDQAITFKVKNKTKGTNYIYDCSLFTMEITNNSKKDISAVRGALKIYDLFGKHIVTLKVDYKGQKIKAGKKITFEKPYNKNEYISETVKVYNEKYSELQFEFFPQTIIYTNEIKTDKNSTLKSSEVVISCTGKSKVPMDVLNGIYDDYARFTFKIENTTNKTIRGIEGGFIITNIFGEELASLQCDFTGLSLKPGKSVTEKKSKDINMFIDEEIELYNTSYEDLFFKYIVTDIVYVD